MPRWKIWAAVVAVLLSLPYALLMAAGGIWMYQYGYLPYFLAFTAVAMVAGSWLARSFNRTRPLRNATKVSPSNTWPPAGDAAWARVEEIAVATERKNLPFDEPQRWLPILREVIDAVAKEFHPRSKDPWLEVSVPDALQIIHLVARDLRQMLLQQVPGSHLLSIKDLERLKQLHTLWQQLYFGYRLISLGLNPVAAAVREIRSAATGQVLDHSIDEVQRWAAGYAVRKAGYYAIQLYSGQLAIEEEDFNTFVTSQSTTDAKTNDERTEKLDSEPLRILVLGQTKAGKSSLINALFGEVRAATDVIPLTRGVEAYVMERAGMPRAIILDTAGYGVGEKDDSAIVDAAILHTDLILLVCSATSAAREPDRQMLVAVKQRFADAKHRSLPPIVVPLSHIDRLRPFNEWQPPYNIATPDSPKAASIAEATVAVSQDLDVPVANVIPACLLPDRLYNVNEAIAPAMLAALPTAERAKLLRALRQFHDEQYWQRLSDQAKNAGRLLVSAGTAWATQAVRQFADQLSKRD